MWKNLKLQCLLGFLLLFFFLPLQELACQSSSDIDFTNINWTQPTSTLNSNNSINWNLPLSQQNWNQLDFTQLSLNDLSKAFNLEYQNSQSLISNLRSQLDFSNLQILSLELSLQSTQDELSRLQQSLNNSIQSHTNMDNLVSQMTQEAGILKEENERYKRKVKKLWITVGISSLGAGISSPLIVEGIRLNNQALIWTGVGTLGATAIFDIVYNFIVK